MTTPTLAKGTLVMPDASAPLSHSQGQPHPVWYRAMQQVASLINTAIPTSGVVATSPRAVSSLPGASQSQGARSFVTDSTLSMTAGIGQVVVGGGSNGVPVHCDGTNWRIG